VQGPCAPCKTRFHWRLVNSVVGDPALFINIEGRKRQAVLIDCGEISRLKISDIQSINTILISHTHMDHFTGFDAFIRCNVGDHRTIHIFGPYGIAKQIQYKLLAYQWNLLDKSGFTLIVHEIEEKEISEYHISAVTRFRKITPKAKTPFKGMVYEEDLYWIEAAILDHKIPSIAYALKEVPFINIDKQRLAAFPSPQGAWVKELKDALGRGDPSETSIKVGQDHYLLEFLQEKLVVQTPGQKIVYVTDTICNSQTEERIIALAADAELFFCECYFMEQDHQKASKTHHLTAYQTGRLARLAQVKKLIGFHYSPKYISDLYAVTQEAQNAFKGAI